MLEMSACSGCVQSGYLLWEHKRRLAVRSSNSHTEIIVYTQSKPEGLGHLCILAFIPVCYLA